MLEMYTIYSSQMSLVFIIYVCKKAALSLSKLGGGKGGGGYIDLTLDFAHGRIIERDPHDDCKEVCFLLDDGRGFELCAEDVDAEDDLLEAGAWAAPLCLSAF